MSVYKSYRKTNLFYNSGQDSNFLTFSNYTESLTGNFLATDWKVYPSKFVCLYIPSLLNENGVIDNEAKKEFIKHYLIERYENKLAFLRDYYYNQEVANVTDTIDREYIVKKIESSIHSFNWLLDTITKFDSQSKITFVGEVTELDYNGVYADTICIIDGSQTSTEAYIQLLEEAGENKIEYSNFGALYPLYGWDENELSTINIEGYDSFELENTFDEVSGDTPYYYGDNCVKLVKDDEADISSIKFNVIIPLYDIINIDWVDNFDQIDEDKTVLDSLIKELNDNEKDFTANSSSGRIDDSEAQELSNEYDKNYSLDNDAIHSINRPLGIWFSEKEIVLDRDETLKYSPTWSLTISSQFKSFPYSLDYKDPSFSLRDDKHAFATYAQILAKQQDFTKLISNLYLQYDSLKEQLREYMSIINNSTTNNGDINIADYSSLISRIERLEAKINELSNVNSRLTEIENNIEQLSNTVNHINTVLFDSHDSVLNKLEILEQKINNISANGGTLDWKTNYTE